MSNSRQNGVKPEDGVEPEGGNGVGPEGRLIKFIGFVSLIILCLSVVWLIYFREAYQSEENLRISIFGTGMVLLGTGVVLAVLTAFGFVAGDFPILDSPWFRVTDRTLKVLLIPITLFLMIALGLICSLSGGASSPFSHFLIGVATMSIVIAKEVKTRVTMIFGTVIIYGLSIIFVVVTPDIPRLLDIGGVLGVVGVAFLYKLMSDRS